jgi:hypothetical protein
LQAPFRFPRVILFGGLGVGASAGLFIITLRLIKALQGQGRMQMMVEGKFK